MIVYPVVVGDLNGSMDRTVFYKVEDRCIGRKKNQSKEREYSDVEREQHLKFGFMVKLARRAKYVVRESLVRLPRYLSAVNYFMRLNLPYCTVEDLEGGVVSFDYERLVFAEGTLASPGVTVSFSEEDNQFTFAVSSQGGRDLPGKKGTDKVFAVLLESQLMQAYQIELGTRGEETTVMEALEPGWNAENVHVYAYAYSKEEKETSNTLYLPLA